MKSVFALLLTLGSTTSFAYIDNDDVKAKVYADSVAEVSMNTALALMSYSKLCMELSYYEGAKEVVAINKAREATLWISDETKKSQSTEMALWAVQCYRTLSQILVSESSFI